MITIAVELNHVIRNFNKQLLKYYKRDFKPELDIDSIDEKKEDVLDKYIKFDSKRERNQFIYIDYAYELFACAKTMDKDLARDMNNWLEEMGNREDETFKVVYYSLNEEALTIQSTYFFLSKLGTRIREMLFPKSLDELKDRCDVVITSNNDVINWGNDNGKQTVKINTNIKEDSENVDSNFNYDSMENVIHDDKFLGKIIENLKK